LSIVEDGVAQGNGAIDLCGRRGDGFHDLVLDFRLSVRRGWGESCKVCIDFGRGRG
jgi:hypothetical protein